VTGSGVGTQAPLPPPAGFAKTYRVDIDQQI
jgi:hypothetical protein